MRDLHLLIAVCALATCALRAQESTDPLPATGELTLRTERVVVFKDGHALLHKRATGVVDDAGMLATTAVPDSAVLGSFWATCEAIPIRSMTAQWVEAVTMRTTDVPCTEMRDLLRANEGREVRLTLQWPEERQLDARIIAVLEEAPAVAAGPELPSSSYQPVPAYASHAPISRWAELPEGPAAGTTTKLASRAGGNFVVLDITAGTGATPRRAIVPVADVRAISGPDLATRTTRVEQVTARHKRLAFEFGTEAAGRAVEIQLVYFTPGLRWIPTYRLDGALEDRGRLALQGEILNELEDLEDASLELVVGVPNFRFGDVISPLSLERVMRDVLAQAAPQLMGQQNPFSNAMFTQRGSEFRQSGQDAGAAGGAMGMAQELAFTGEQDLFVYAVGRRTIPRGARTSVPLWTSEVALRHVYTMDVDVVRDVAQGNAARVTGDRESPLELAQNDVWHQLELRNPGPMPWTTGAALVTKDGLPLGQDLLTYTPVTGAARLPVTVAVDVRGDYDEQEIAREVAGIRWNGDQYARIVKRGTVRVTNYRDEAVDLRIAVGLGGKVLATEGDPAVVVRDFRAADWQNGRQDYRLNGHSDVTWTFRLEPGATREVWLEVEMYVR
ncbi:MAG: hypothetical protein IPM29_26025 [Planctomycetes bacterium]|nr:hypothetical protein [Planctomycetota bacterium]